MRQLTESCQLLTQLFVTSWGTVFDFYTQTKSLHFFKTAMLKVANNAESRLLAQKLFLLSFYNFKAYV